MEPDEIHPGYLEPIWLEPCDHEIQPWDALEILVFWNYRDEYYASEINHGRLYPNLDELVGAGYVEKGQIDDRTNAYSLTEKERVLLKERLEWENQYVEL